MDFDQILGEHFVKKFWSLNSITRKLVVVTGATTACLFLRYFYLSASNRHHKYVPALYGVPIFGSMFTMAIHDDNFFSNIVPKYGPLLSFKLGALHWISVNDPKLIEAMFSTDHCINVPKFISYNDSFDNTRILMGIVDSCLAVCTL